MTDAPVLSPLSGLPCRRELEIPVQQIVELYATSLNLDVAGYFQACDVIGIYLCGESDYRFYHPIPEMGDSHFYARLQERPNYYIDWKWENEVACGFIEQDDLVLDVGCGSGAFVSGLLSRRRVDATGIDTNAHAIAAARQKGAGRFLVSNITDLLNSDSTRYDVVTCFQVLEHVPDPMPFLAQLLKGLASGARLIIGVPNNNPYLYRHEVLHLLNLPPHHAGLWNRRSLRYVARRFGLEIDGMFSQPIGEQLEHYTQVQLRHLEGTSRFHRRLLQSGFSAPVAAAIRRYIRLRGQAIEGHTILGVFRKAP